MVVVICVCFTRVSSHHRLNTRYPRNTANYPGSPAGPGPTPGSVAPVWIPLPPRPVDGKGNIISAPGEAPVAGEGGGGGYDLRMEFVCLSAEGCGDRKVGLLWTNHSDSGASDTTADPTPVPIPAAVLVPTASPAETARRAMYADLESGWGTFYRKSFLAWELLPEGFLVRLALLQVSTGQFLAPDGLTVHKLVAAAFLVVAPVDSIGTSPVDPDHLKNDWSSAQVWFVGTLLTH